MLTRENVVKCSAGRDRKVHICRGFIFNAEPEVMVPLVPEATAFHHAHAQ